MFKKMNKKILFISYYSNLPGACQAEWADDKVHSLLQGGSQIELVTSLCSDLRSLGIRSWRVPSISLHDFQDEKARLKNQLKLRMPSSVWLIVPIIYTIGVAFDFILKLTTKGVGEGRWSWSLPAAFVCFVICLIRRPDVILSTGGPASAHLAGIFVSKLLRIPIKVELQDPLSGDSIGRNARSASYLEIVETFIVRNSTKIYYVTKKASEAAVSKYGTSNIAFLYPGARVFSTENFDANFNRDGRLSFIHLGSLYSTRTFDNLILSFDELINRGEISTHDFRLINLGHVEERIKLRLVTKPYVEILQPVNRIEALKIASMCDYNLLIQNTDNRSMTTIPYKTYDYLNLGNSVILLHNNSELDDLVKNHGHVSIPLLDQPTLTRELRAIFSDRDNKKRVVSSCKIDPVAQAEMLAWV